MKNKLIDLNNHLFAQLERLSDEDINGEKLTEEINRSRAIGMIANNIINNANLALSAKKAIHDDQVRDLPLIFGIENKNG